MNAIRVSNFQGLSPAVAPELLQDAGAQRAANCNLLSGDIRPLYAGTLTYTTNVTGVLKSIFRISEPTGDAWLAWANEVNCVKGPITGLGRYYYSGDGEPRATTLALAIDGAGGAYPSLFRALGLPAPVTAPTVSPSGGVGAAVSRYYVYTFYDDWDQESAVSPLTALLTGKVDDTWAISGMDATPPNSGDITAVTYIGDSVTITTTNTHFNRVGENVTIAGVTTVTNVNGTWELTAVNIASKTMTFTVTTTPTGTYVDGTDTTDTWTRVAPFGTCSKRIYRTSGSTAQFQLVKDGETGTTFNDTILDADIPGDELISTDWVMPPVDLSGLFLHPSGALGGVSGNELCFSEPYQPHAWPVRYRLRTDYPIKATAVYGSSVAVATTGTPYTAYGTEPGQIALVNHNGAYPCLSMRSMVPTLTGAVYASPLGLVQVSDNGAQVITGNLYDKDQWDEVQPSLMFGASVDGRLYYGVQESGERAKILVFGTKLTVAEIEATALYADLQNGKLYYTVGNRVYAYNQPGTSFLPQDWKSKEFVLPQPCTLTAAKILFDTVIPPEVVVAEQATYDADLATNVALVATGDVGGWLNGYALDGMTLNGDDLLSLSNPSNATASVSFELYADGELKHSRVVENGKPFRLPSGYLASRYAFRVTSTCRVKAVEIAENVEALRNV